MIVSAPQILGRRRGLAVGAWVATRVFLDGLEAAGHKVVYGNRLPRGAKVVVSHLGDGGRLHREAADKGAASVRMSHSPPTHATGDLGDVVVVNSQATASAFNGWPGRVEVIHPATFPDRYRIQPAGRIDGRVTLVNVTSLKGAGLFWQLADAMPDVSFLAVKGGYGQQRIPHTRPRNVAVTQPVVDIRSVLRRTSVLLMPSTREAWGLIGVEAMCSGIPVVASPTAGLVEALGDGATFMEARTVDAWESTIRGLLGNETVYREASKRATARIAELDPQGSVDRFVALIEEIAKTGGK